MDHVSSSKGNALRPCDVPVGAQVVDSMPCPLGIPPDGDVPPQQLQRVGPVDVQVRLQRNRPPVAGPVEGRLVLGRRGVALSVVIFDRRSGGCNRAWPRKQPATSSVALHEDSETHICLSGSREARLWSELCQLALRRGTARRRASAALCVCAEPSAGHIASKQTWRCVAGQAQAAA